MGIDDALSMNLPAGKIDERGKKQTGLLGLMTDTSLSHHAKFLGFRAARESINQGQLAAVLYGYFHLAQQMFESATYRSDTDPLMNFIDGFRLGHDKNERRDASDRCDIVLKKAVPANTIKAYKDRIDQELREEAPQLFHNAVFPR